MADTGKADYGLDAPLVVRSMFSRGGWTRRGEFLRVRIEGSEDFDFQAAALS